MTLQGSGAAEEPPREPRPEGDLAQPRAGEPVATPGAASSPPGATSAPPVQPAASARRRAGILGRAAGAVGSVVLFPWHVLQRRFPWLSLSSRRGKLLVIFLVAAFASVLTVGGVMAVAWTETPDFCGRCHTMGPELKAHAISPHRELACAECHVEPGVEGWIKAKINGTRQLIQLVTGTFPTPIPPPGHGDLPPTSETCRRCHDANALVQNGPVKLVLDNQFAADEGNSKSTVALVLRPAGFGDDTAARGVHWHIDLDVEYSTTDRRSQQIQLVTVTDKQGNTTEYIANKEVTRADQVENDVKRLEAANPLVRMDCIDCHNRVGHQVPSLNEAIDSSMEAGTISPTLPYIKKEALDTLSATYATTEQADAAIDQIKDFYAAKYPLVASQKPGAIQGAIDELKSIYDLVATPDMQVSANTYPNNLGHKNYPGCFRCHDGAHFKVENGQLTNEVIPSTCSTCHTFPQVGTATTATSFLIGQRPDSHLDAFWIFDHKNVANTDAGQATCAACHTQTYCQNCHTSPAINVPHDNMLYTHPAVIQKLGGTATCALCHQPTECENCHPKGVPGFSSSPSPTFSTR